MDHSGNPFTLSGQHAVVTGGASGIGKAIAEAFAGAGAHVTVLDLDLGAAEKTARGLGSEAAGVACDVSDEESVARAFAGTGPINILVNSAGIAHIGTALSTEPADFDRLFRVNVRGTYLCMQAALVGMQARKRGVILNIASIAETAALPERFAYSMTKGAVLAMTLSVAKDFLVDGIRCNCVSPARVHTPFVDGYLARTYPGLEDEMFRKLAATQPVGRMGEPHEIAMLALYLCCGASGFVTGCDYPIDGGFLNLR